MYLYLNPSKVFEYISLMDSDKPHWLPIQSLVLKFDQQFHCRLLFSVLPAHCWPYQMCDKYSVLTVEPVRLSEVMLRIFIIWYVYLVVLANTDQHYFNIKYKYKPFCDLQFKYMHKKFLYTNSKTDMFWTQPCTRAHTIMYKYSGAPHLSLPPPNQGGWSLVRGFQHSTLGGAYND